ncbi:abscission/NoCut checkpoint regulator [Microplitis demolitor]|uniref:abscission/NoCut checkpoint regulator n=1 Tax=Microplitis demolitor TaxID=69319 RepID=UPI00043FFEDB|nr:abscission/NoCut checkpoint regulator [Microplitis demolitor]
MSCCACQTKFSLFTREHGCPSCGFSYCNKCLKYKYKLPDDKIKSVCGPCYHRLIVTAKNYYSTSEEQSIYTKSLPNPLLPVDIEQKLNSLDNPEKPPIVMYKPGRWDQFKAGLDPVDQALVDRLSKLKDQDKQPSAPTTEEIQRRLAELKDQNPDRKPPINIYQVDTRTNEQKTDDLIQQYFDELSLTKDSSTKEIEERLNKLKNIDPSLPSASSSYANAPELDEFDIVKNMISRALVEAAMEKRFGEENPEEQMDLELNESSGEISDCELTCVMCDKSSPNELVRCRGCSGDIYCLSCYNENHDDFELSKHKIIKLK